MCVIAYELLSAWKPRRVCSARTHRAPFTWAIQRLVRTRMTRRRSKYPIFESSAPKAPRLEWLLEAETSNSGCLDRLGHKKGVRQFRLQLSCRCLRSKWSRCPPSPPKELGTGCGPLSCLAISCCCCRSVHAVSPLDACAWTQQEAAF